ncbi:hypothetical protein DOZ80_17805 [Pseudomonas fluorescens]|uniref:Uncharacterized protein n=1 Tax=Pseudomonas fluorescens TaxID=294 RepID=A0A327MZ23_PSEFL|nr:hypothetical protein DOZ80_17805 [Pseudomonas fluorescens]
MWRGSLLPPGREAAPKNASASQPIGSKLPRHNDPWCLGISIRNRSQHSPAGALRHSTQTLHPAIRSRRRSSP